MAKQDQGLAPPPEMPAQEQPQDLGGLLTTLEDEVVMLKRAVVGYSSLALLCRQAAGEDIGRKKGLPVLTFPAGAEDGKPLEVRTDLRKVPQEYLNGVLAPMCHVHAGEMSVAIGKINQIAAALANQIAVVLQPAPAPAPPAAEEGDEETGE